LQFSKTDADAIAPVESVAVTVSVTVSPAGTPRARYRPAALTAPGIPDVKVTGGTPLTDVN
jgi:hypothetical protein